MTAAIGKSTSWEPAASSERAGLAKAGQAAFTIRAEQIRTVIEEMVVYYGTYGAEAEQKTSELLDNLHKADPVAGAKWEKIMNLWKTVNTDPEIHEGILPDGLPETD
ncbi:MAG: hypothetical protein IKT26_00860, partial [Bacteroidaceae bacterium]|nr:hypothetical protein [Bacteroidaceae bacterium]